MGSHSHRPITTAQPAFPLRARGLCLPAGSAEETEEEKEETEEEEEKEGEKKEEKKEEEADPSAGWREQPLSEGRSGAAIAGAAAFPGPRSGGCRVLAGPLKGWG